MIVRCNFSYTFEYCVPTLVQLTKQYRAQFLFSVITRGESKTENKKKKMHHEKLIQPVIQTFLNRSRQHFIILVIHYIHIISFVPIIISKIVDTVVVIVIKQAENVVLFVLLELRLVCLLCLLYLLVRQVVKHIVKRCTLAQIRTVQWSTQGRYWHRHWC